MKTFLIVFTTYILGIGLISFTFSNMVKSKTSENPFSYSHVLINN